MSRLHQVRKRIDGVGERLFVALTGILQLEHRKEALAS